MTVTGVSTFVEELAGVRRRTLELVAHLGAENLERQLSPILSPLVWDLAHIAAYEDLWLVHRHAGAPLLHPELAALYDAFETPRAVRGDLELLDRDGACAYLDDVRARTVRAIDTHGLDPVVHEMVLRHELQHTETMRQAMALGGLLPPGEPRLPPLGPEPADPWLAVPAGRHAVGAGDRGFSYDNERPRHDVELPAFRIARRPVTNATWLSFVEGGGYVRREWWSDEGWAWKQDYDITHHPGGDVAAALPPDAPVCHVSWLEAGALARWCGARLPTEQEWEAAAGRLEAVGLVWEWTASPFTGYPGFTAFPYREYSEVFFGPDHRVLRGGSWATDPRVATRTFRNWDLPHRRQIFAGVRLARDAEDPGR
jgi:iron(II)-dependent oxidoreductase